MALDVLGLEVDVWDFRTKITDHAKKIMVRLLRGDWVCAECLVESTLGVTSNLYLALGEAVELVKSMDEGDNAENAPEFTAV